MNRPLGLLAELTHRCPLHCSYCSNPVELTRRTEELGTGQWIDVLDQARELGVLQVHLSGGEPLSRRDLPELVSHAHRIGCYLNLVTSGLALTAEVAEDLAARGLDHVQLSIQDSRADEANAVAGTRGHQLKLRAASVVRELGLALTVNVVLHKGNLDRVGEIIALAEQLGADRLELANTQYYGWAALNRRALLPTRAQLDRAAEVVEEARGGPMDIVYVTSDYYEDRPKPCMQGWASRQLTVAPDGRVLPCPVAGVIADLPAENVLARPLAEIWYSSAAFNAFRGTDWMREPCRSCALRDVDFGGCRCQSYALTGDAAATDPVCGLSPHRHVVDELLESTGEIPVAVPRRERR
ncbi:pyrroloquinoline quinone biosynthesis protein PqqE [Saccharopolyspora taberi]|uniref:PqqA peptide cyclase n=1 Tax=Saccharopolyspora taberi TaxID=60895 RepID=A0ABN3VHE2_9PSEU